jgi:hypothetical protein
MSMSQENILIYASPNGDCWYLVRDPDPERLSVRHQPNRASGGQSTVLGIEGFLAEGHGPQHEALCRHLEQLGYVPPLHRLHLVQS